MKTYIHTRKLTHSRYLDDIFTIGQVGHTNSVYHDVRHLNLLKRVKKASKLIEQRGKNVNQDINEYMSEITCNTRAIFMCFMPTK